MRRWFRTVLAMIVVCATLFGAAAFPALAEENNGRISFTEAEEEYIAAHRDPIRVGYVQDRIPVSFTGKNGELAGISRYIFDYLGRLSGLQFEYVALPAGDITYDFLLGENLALVTSVEYNKENQNARGILISNPYLSSRKVVVARRDLDFSYSAHLTVAISTGSQTLRKVLGGMYPNFELRDYDSISECFDAVKSGEADIMIQNQYVVEYWFSKPSYEKLKVIPVLGLDDQLCFSAVVAIGDGEGPSQEDGRILIDILNKAIAAMTEEQIGSCTIQGIMENQYSYTLADFLYRYRVAATIFTVSAVVILVLALLLIRQHIRITESRAESKAKGQFLSTMSHEIRTPLNGLIGLNYLMSQKLDDKGRMREYLRQSTVTAKYLLSLVNDILDSSKLQARQMELARQPVDLGLVTDTVSSIAQNAMEEKDLIYETDGELKWPCILGDEVRIQQVLLNLLDNARKFTPEGGRVTCSLKQEMTPAGDVLTTFSVSDTGRGMSPEFQKHVFDVFARELDTVSKGNQGTGLGLSISRRLALLMGGDLTVTSQKGEGSTFVFTFTAPPSEIAQDENDPAFLTKDSPHPHVLVAEDNELNGEIILELLLDYGFEADLAENGKIALDMFEASREGTYGVILMDLLMPEMDGFEATKAIRALKRPDAKTVRIYACTANSLAEERDKALACGMDGFIAKPVDIGELMKKLSGQD